MPDARPRATKHNLVIPTSHIGLDDLVVKPDAVAVLYHLARLALDSLGRSKIKPEDGLVAPDLRIGFHPPPFCSHPHLHLHALELPFTSHANSLRFAANSLHFGYVSLAQVIDLVAARDASAYTAASRPPSP